MASSQTFEHEQNFNTADEASELTQRLQRAQWLRAAILGANDGLLSTTSLMLGVGAAKDDRWSMILSGLAGALAGSCSMAVGEFVSVSTQRDIEEATLVEACSSDHVKSIEMIMTPGSMSAKTSKPKDTNLGLLDPKLPPQVLSPRKSPIIKVIAKDVNTEVRVQKHMKNALPNPYKAAAASASAFLCGSVVPLASAVFIADHVVRLVVIAVVSSIALYLFGCFGAYLGGSSVRVSAVRVLIGGWIAMAITYGLLKPFNSVHHNRDVD